MVNEYLHKMVNDISVVAQTSLDESMLSFQGQKWVIWNWIFSCCTFYVTFQLNTIWWNLVVMFH